MLNSLIFTEPLESWLKAQKHKGSRDEILKPMIQEWNPKNLGSRGAIKKNLGSRGEIKKTYDPFRKAQKI